jgi:hypothetical protein
VCRINQQPLTMVIFALTGLGLRLLPSTNTQPANKASSLPRHSSSRARLKSSEVPRT